jgi:hypothetical protein
VLLLRAQHATLFVSDKTVSKLKESTPDKVIFGFRKTVVLRNAADAKAAAAYFQRVC